MMWFYDEGSSTKTVGARGGRIQSFGPSKSLEKCAISPSFCSVDGDLSDLPIFIRTSDGGWKPEANEARAGSVSVSHDGTCQTYKLANAGSLLEYRVCAHIGVVEMQSNGSKGSHHLVLRSFRGLGANAVN
jgi:hypothetical protein